MMGTKSLKAIPYAHLVVALALFGGTATALVQQGMPVLFPFIQEEFGATRAQLGLITSGLTLGATGSVLIMGWLADAIGARRLWPATLIIVASGVFLFSQIQSLTQGVLLAALISTASSATPTSSGKAITDWVTPQTRGLSMGINQTAIPISGFIAAALLPFLAVTFSWRTALIVLAVTIAVISIVLFSLYRDKPRSFTTIATGNLLSSTAFLARNRDIWLVGLSNATLMALHLVFVSYLILFLKEHAGMSEAVAAGYLAVAFVGGAVGRIGWGLISDSIGGRRALILAMICVLCTLFMVFMAWLPPDASPMIIGPLAFLLGTTALGWPGVYNAFVVELAGPGLAGTGVGFAFTIRQVGGIVPPLFGLTVDRTGSYDVGWWMMAGVAIIGALLLIFVRPQPQIGELR